MSIDDLIEVIMYGINFQEKETLLEVKEKLKPISEECISLAKLANNLLEVIRLLIKGIDINLEKIFPDKNLYQYSTNDAIRTIHISKKTLRYYRNCGVIRYITIKRINWYNNEDIKNFHQNVRKYRIEKRKNKKKLKNNQID